VRLVFAEPAARDLEDIIAFIALDDRRAAEQVYRTVVSATELLTEFPALGHPGRMPETREYSVAKHPYVIVYEASASTVTVLAVFHGARDLARALASRRREIGG
jgi:toxin ParE1/3/4